MLMMAQTQ